MKRVLWTIVLILLLIAVVILLFEQPGYVVLQLTHYSTTIPLWLVLLGIIVVIIIVALVWKGIVTLFSLPSRIKGHFDRNRQQKQQEALEAGLRAWVARDWLSVAQHFDQLNRSDWNHALAQLITQHAKAQSNKASS